jgi:hypothetical protein
MTEKAIYLKITGPRVSLLLLSKRKPVASNEAGPRNAGRKVKIN